MTIGITAASGQLGRLAVAALKRRLPAGEIVALVRTPAKAADLGVATRAADYADPESLAAAFAGIDRLLFISSGAIGDERAVQHGNVVAAARRAGVPYLAYTSLLRADTTPIALGPSHVATEAAIRDTGIPFTFMRNGWYSENYAGSIAGALAGGAVIGGSGAGRISSASRADYAEAAAAVIAGEGHEGRTYELAGDTAWTLADLAAEISRQTGRDVPFRNLSEADHAAALAAAGLPLPVAQVYAGIDQAVAADALFDESRTLSALVGRPTTPLADTVAEVLKSLATAPAGA